MSEPKALFSDADLDVLRVQTEERKTQADRLRDTTKDARAWDDYHRASRYFGDILLLIVEAQRAS